MIATRPPEVSAPGVYLTTPRLVVREFTLDDVDDVLAVVGDERVTRWLSFDSRDRTAAVAMVTDIVARAGQADRAEYYLAVEVAEAAGGRQVIGFVRLARNGHAAKLGYAIRHEMWGRGLAVEAVRALVSYGFDDLDLHRITAAIGPANSASVKVVSTLGFDYEGLLRCHVRTSDGWRASLLFSVLRDEWKP